MNKGGNRRSGDYDVGYGKPPEHTRFRKGQSGNPKGRPRASKNFKTIVRNVLNQAVPITIDGKTRRVTSQEALLEQMRRDAFQGNRHARDKLLELARVYNSEELEAGLKNIGEDDTAILENYRARLLRQSTKEESPAAEPTESNEEDDDSWLK